MDDEKRIEVKYQLTPEVLKVGVSDEYDHRHRVRKWLKITALIWFALLLGLLVYFQLFSLSNWILQIFLVYIAFTCLFNKYFYVKRNIRAAFKGRDKEINIHFTGKEGGFSVKTDESETSSLWTGLIKYLITDNGLLLYPQEDIFNFVPKESSEISGGTWDEFIEMIVQNVKVTVK